MGDVLCISRFAASSVSKSAVTPAERARSRSSSGDHHSDGIELRRRHLKVASTVVPISRAKADRVGHRSIISRNEEIIRDDLGHTVLDCKSKSSQDTVPWLGHDVLMVPRIPRQEVRRGFIQRTREARARTGLSQEAMAEKLRMQQGTYKNYEISRPLPHELVPEFCEICGILPLDLYGIATVRRAKAG